MTDTRFTVAACDLDDTLLRSDGTISSRTEAAIARWLDAGRRFVIATGRPSRSIEHAVPAILHEVPWISYNGAEIRHAGEVIYRRFIPEGTLPPLVDRLLMGYPETTVGLEIDDLLWLNRPRLQLDGPNPHHRVVDLNTVAHRASAKMLLFAEDLDALTAACHPLPPGVRLMQSGRYHFLQLMSTQADKVHALRHLLEGWGQSLENVVAFGDDINDVEMLHRAGLGVAVANAWPPAWEAAVGITASNDEDGVALVLESLLDADGL